MLELSSFGPDKTGPKSRRGRGTAMASISAEDTSSGYAEQASGRTDFPMTDFSASSQTRSRDQSHRAASNYGGAQAAREDSTAEQL